MTFIRTIDRGFLDGVSRLAYCNPFTPERIDLERQTLGDAYVETGATWSKQSEWDRERPNIVTLRARCEDLAETLLHKLLEGETASSSELRLYEDLISYLLYDRYRQQFATASQSAATKSRARFDFASNFRRDARRYLQGTGVREFQDFDADHLFACCFQVCRAFREIFHHIVGASRPAAKLRSRVWQSIVTHDMRRYRRCLFGRMADFTTLITGPSGTGKELVARAIGLSRYVPFDAEQGTISGGLDECFYPLNLSALSSTLIESELFGHACGAFTGAVKDRSGWLELCPPCGTVFLDEIGDVEASIQVKLLRVFQSRSFQRLGETSDREFHGKVIAATNQDLEAKTRDGSFRNDFYFRLCSDIVATPSLQEQLNDCPDDLTNLAATCVFRVVGEEDPDLVDEIVRWIRENLGDDYAWPGNVRELEQCVRNLLLRNEYRPRLAQNGGSRSLRRQVAEEVAAGALTADEMLRRYCTLVYAETGSYEQTARRLELDRRTVKSRIDETLLKQLMDAD